MLSSSHIACLPTSSSRPPNPSTRSSDPCSVTMETLWREVRSIEEEAEGEEEDETERKSMDEVELEEAWLTEAGLSSLVTDEATPLAAEVLLSTLTRQQTATVKKRLHNYSETLKSRSRQPIRDVRDIFMEMAPPTWTQRQALQPDDTADRCPAPSSQGAESPPRPYSVTTKTIRRNAHTVRPTLPTFRSHDQRGEDAPPPQHPPSETSTHSSRAPVTPASTPRAADWLLREYPYSEGVAEHKQRGTCWDCLRFHGDDRDDLPFGLVSPAQGLTWAEDLSPHDLTSLGFICHIELSTFLQTLGVQTKRTRSRCTRTRDTGVFGVPLNSLLENDRKNFPGIKVPVVFQKLLWILENSLQTEGILRVPGSAARLKFLRRELDRCCGGFDWSAVRLVDAAGLLKLFIRELPTPLLTHTHLSTYHSVLGISSVVHQVQALQLLMLLLPEAHRETLRVSPRPPGPAVTSSAVSMVTDVLLRFQALLVFLRQVVFHQDQNKMSLWNVSMVMSPNLFSCRRPPNEAARQQEMDQAVGGAYLVRLMVTHQDLLWAVPNFLLSQVRHMNQASHQKQLILSKTRRLLTRKSKNDLNQITELCEGVIRVHAPLHTKVSMAIQLDGQMRARDVTCRFECDNSPLQNLYEVGGNITERRLHPDCVLLEVYRVNPHCDWLIKP
ncbi:rho GTPase-activating protein 28 isoform X3 [Takifugu rubripes]|uniref:rho GTPase-activating protein 28 isoform X3 n=1 Tax=Takifugu rubripes TaxID=31033 RepID=UPI00114537B7|nr:rho GTPase-activating protein 28-like isoform X3 [Takifugu rubripes]